MLSIETTDSLVAALPYERITSWSQANLGLSTEAFDAVVSHLHQLEEVGLVDLLSISRFNTSGAAYATAVKFVRLRESD